ncbi:MerR family transcriptional regulator [Sphingomonas sp.]|uniref:MerR family transcriptional regulator n=1 Tax=Sphingomonas sp. TaxID=28214 RepID=UPI002C9C8006|nr:MerR family transcriptional regulator [Sphingomonas sp.]HWK37163.1 MerR family transcriptional regulator [Sphingomonas sp.]
MAAPDKAAGAFRTIGELSQETSIPQHILRYWETRFPQLRPLQRAGRRRYYRPEDVALVRRIQHLLDNEGYTIRGVQKLLASETPAKAVRTDRDALKTIRADLASALDADG